MITVMSDAVTKTVVPLRHRIFNLLNRKHINGVTIDKTPLQDHIHQTRSIHNQMENIAKETDGGRREEKCKKKAAFMTWTSRDVFYVTRKHWIPSLVATVATFFVFVEYTFQMNPASSEPFDLGFLATRSLHGILASSPNLNTVLAALNTMLVAMDTAYFAWTWFVEGRPRVTIAALFMFACRGILGYTTQLPLPQEFIGSGVDYPVGNVSFFLFYSGHVAATTIASLDMKRMKRFRLAMFFDIYNVLQSIRLLGTRGHYTIDILVGVGAGLVFDSLAGKYEETIRPP